jgi:hypothetical protein
VGGEVREGREGSEDALFQGRTGVRLSCRLLEVVLPGWGLVFSPNTKKLEEACDIWKRLALGKALGRLDA